MRRPSVWVLFGLTLLAVSFHGINVSAETPSESECRPYIEKAIHDFEKEHHDCTDDKLQENISSEHDVTDQDHNTSSEDHTTESHDEEISHENTSAQENSAEDVQSHEENSAEVNHDDSEEMQGDQPIDESEEHETHETHEESTEENVENGEESTEGDQNEDESSNERPSEEEAQIDNESEENENQSHSMAESQEQSEEEHVEEHSQDQDSHEDHEDHEEHDEHEEHADHEVEHEEHEEHDESHKQHDEEQSNEEHEHEAHEDHEDHSAGSEESEEHEVDEVHEKHEQHMVESEKSETEEEHDESVESEQMQHDAPVEESEEIVEHIQENVSSEDVSASVESHEEIEQPPEQVVTELDENVSIELESEESLETVPVDEEVLEDEIIKEETQETATEAEDKESEVKEETEEVHEEKAPVVESEVKTADETASNDTYPEEDLLLEYHVPDNLRDRTHIAEILHLDNQSEDKENAINKVADVILRDLKRIYESAIKPLETLYKYRDLSNRHFGDPEIFSKPLVLFMGPWSGGKSTILNYLTENEYTTTSVRTGAEPSPAYFNILMHGDEPEVLDGTQLAADWTFSGLQKFGQGLEDRLRGLKLPSKLLEKVNIVEIPGILEVRKQVSRLFPFNDACQWFIDRADIIFLVYDPSKLDVGPETEAILDQLKGREYQTRILLNKADMVKPEELMRVQSALIWNISPLMSSAQPPIMYTTSLWSNPYEVGAPMRLLQAHERAFLRDLRAAIDNRIENKIASARRFAVRVRNHAKMVDCYLTTYYNHKTLFGNKKHISDQIIENPQNYHIYEGLSTLTNISRYDLPDPEVYRDFFRLNPLYEFKKLSETCTYFRGCPINKLDIAIAYDLPELTGKYKKSLETALHQLEKSSSNEKS